MKQWLEIPFLIYDYFYTLYAIDISQWPVGKDASQEGARGKTQ